MSTPSKPALYALTPEAHATVMLALGHLQGMLASRPDARPATYAHGTVTPLDYAGIDRLRQDLNHTGLDFGPVVNLLGSDESNPYVAAALESDHLREGEIEVDVPTIVSEGDDNGAYVMAWIWIKAPYQTLQLNLDPAEPVFYFDDVAEFDNAVEIANKLGLTYSIENAFELPPDEEVSDADEFESYAEGQGTRK
jgi:hypothetical protein